MAVKGVTLCVEFTHREAVGLARLADKTIGGTES